jgi:two-component system sensor histidine kinase KdpD
VLNRLKDELQTHPVKTESDEDLPLIKLDSGLIEQAIYNIVYNATVYTPEDSEIKIETILVNKTLRITISDTGSGFAPDEIDKVFTKYFYSEKAKKGGIGLGLSISKGFIDAHSGTIKVQNQPAGGAKFTIELPTEIFRVFGDLDFSDLTVKANIHDQQANNPHHRR